MKKRIILPMLLLSLVILFLFVPWLFAQQTASTTSTTETINLSTYYPSPFGAYDTFRLVPKRDALFVPPPCTPQIFGTMYVDFNGKLQICGSVDGIPTWGPADQIWTKSGDNIYPADTNFMVGIGTINPATDLGKGLDVHGNVYIHMAPTDAGLIFGDNNPVNSKWHIGYWAPSFLPPKGGLVFTETGVADHILTLQAGGNIGIGVSSPLARLEIKGAGNGADAGNPTYGLGIRNSVDQYSLIVRDDGNVGIGVNPTSALEVGGMTKTTGGLVMQTIHGSAPPSPITGQMWIEFPIVCGDGFCDPGEKNCPETCEPDCGCCPVDGGCATPVGCNGSCSGPGTFNNGTITTSCTNPPPSCGGNSCTGGCTFNCTYVCVQCCTCHTTTLHSTGDCSEDPIWQVEDCSQPFNNLNATQCPDSGQILVCCGGSEKKYILCDTPCGPWHVYNP